jgi:hypothetical protein
MPDPRTRAILYSDQGRHGLRDAMLERLDSARQDNESSGDVDDDDSRDPDQLELA